MFNLEGDMIIYNTTDGKAPMVLYARDGKNTSKKWLYEKK